MSGFATISCAQLARLIGTPEAPTVVDVRTEEDFAADPRLIPTSLRHSHDLIADLAPALAGHAVVIACQRGRKLSEGAAALLRALGVAAESLDGGTVAWAEAGLPMVPAAALPATHRWVTRQRPKIDRIACPWLIRRFIDPGARILYVAPSEVADVAARFNATPFDIPGVRFSHHGPLCTFDSLLDHFSLRTKPLDTLARIIRAADTDRFEEAPEAAGLHALSVGLSRQYKEDHAQLDAGLPLYDALYRWARDGQDEHHSWDQETRA